ncbi:MAG: DUF5050 domain-containing protein [Firmicutes bacterium]|nr:DUF5050 domain-containing protein [Bacillota bacterium]
MLKRTFMMVLVVAMLLSTVAIAEVTNRDMQLQGGVLVSNAADSFFFCPMEPGVTRHWGLYALSSASDRPILEVADGIPARLVQADDTYVYFLGYANAERTLHALYAVNISTGAVEELLSDIAAAFVEESDSFLYVTQSDPYTLCRYKLSTRKQTNIKSMQKAEKTIYDAHVYKGNLYFSTKDKNGTEDGYRYNDGTGLANNLDKPSPQLITGVLYEGYRLYYNDTVGSRLYSVKLGNKSGTQIGGKYKVGMTSPRFGDAVYAYDGENHALVRVPLDASAEKTLALEGGVLNRFILGGSKDELLLYNNGAIYAIAPNLSSQTRLFDFDTASGGLMWTHIVPAAHNAVAVFGYNGETASNVNNMLPTGVYIFDRSTGAQIFGYPEYDPANPVTPTRPEFFGDVPEDARNAPRPDDAQGAPAETPIIETPAAETPEEEPLYVF